MYVIASGQQNNMNTFVCYQHYQRPDCQSKTTWSQACILARQKPWWIFFINSGYHACMLFWKGFTIFPKTLSYQSSYFRFKLVGLCFSVVSSLGRNGMQRSQQVQFHVMWLCRSISHSQLGLTHACALMWTWSQARVNYTIYTIIYLITGLNKRVKHWNEDSVREIVLWKNLP